jgi:hypothetical protein
MQNAHRCVNIGLYAISMPKAGVELIDVNSVNFKQIYRKYNTKLLKEYNILVD